MQSVMTDKLVALRFQIKLEFGMSVLEERGKPEYWPEKNLSEQGQELTTNSTHMTPSPRIEPWPHWWEASAITTSPSLLLSIGSGHDINNCHKLPRLSHASDLIQMYPERDTVPQLLPSQLFVCLFCRDC